jgi:hypothetical protein
VNNDRPTAELLTNIPPELREQPLWIPYYADKKPIDKYGTPEDRQRNCRTLDAWLSRSQQHKGYSLWIDPAAPFAFVDLDPPFAWDEKSETWKPEALAIVEQLNSYTEVSSSGRGLHIVVRGKLPEDFNAGKGTLPEFWSGHKENKTISLTGNLYDDILYRTVESRQEQLEQLFKSVKSKSAPQEALPVAVALEKRKQLESELDALSQQLIEATGAGRPTEELSKQIAATAQALKELGAVVVPKTWRDVFHTGSELDSAPGKVFIKGILEEGITYFGALSGVGKTWIGLSIAHALLSKKPLFGVFPVINTATVLYLVPEMGGRKFRQRMLKMRISMDGGFFCQTIKDGACDLEDPLLLQAIKDTQAIVILDTAIRFQGGDEQSSSEQSQGLGAKMFKLIAAGAPAIICMHHRSKDRKDKEPTLENALRGTTDFGAHADVVWCVEHSRKKKDGRTKFDEEYEDESRSLTRLTLTCVKPRDMEPADPFTIQGRPYIDEKGDFVVLESTGTEDAAATKELPADDSKVRAMVEAVQKDPKTSQRALRKLCGFGFPRIIQVMAEKGWILTDSVWACTEPDLL